MKKATLYAGIVGATLAAMPYTHAAVPQQTPGPGPSPGIEAMVCDQDQVQEYRKITIDATRTLIDATSHFEQATLYLADFDLLQSTKEYQQAARKIKESVETYQAAIGLATVDQCVLENEQNAKLTSNYLKLLSIGHEQLKAYAEFVKQFKETLKK